MANNITKSFKRMQIDKANTVMFGAIAVAAFLVVFTLVSARALWVKRSYQGRIIQEKEAAVEQINANLAAIDSLNVAYQAFVGTPENVLGGSSSGKGDKDGDNAKITLDALPSKYDFPALATSLEKILKTRNFQIDSITGTDDEVAQNSSGGQEVVAVDSSGGPVEIPFEISATGNLESAKDLASLLQKSIRPLRVSTMQVSGSNSDLQIVISGKTYYQPEKKFEIKKKVVK